MKGKRTNYDPETGLFLGLSFEELDSVSIAPTESTEVGEEENVADDPDQENGEVEEEEKNEEAGEDNPSSDDVLVNEMDYNLNQIRLKIGQRVKVQFCTSIDCG